MSHLLRESTDDSPVAEIAGMLTGKTRTGIGEQISSLSSPAYQGAAGKTAQKGPKSRLFIVIHGCSEQHGGGPVRLRDPLNSFALETSSDVVD